MRTIYKYPIQITGEVQKIEMPQNGRICDFQEQGTHPTLWVEVNTEMPTEIRKFQIFGTGVEIPDPDDHNYCYRGTVQRGIYVWHLFEITP